MSGSLRARVLVVEDHEDAAQTLTELLELWGHEVCHATSGWEALELVREFAPDVMLVDIGLPGMDGYEVARQVRALGGHQPRLLVAVTGYGQEEDRRRSRDAGFDCHLVKPIDLGILARLVTGGPGEEPPHENSAEGEAAAVGGGDPQC